MSQDETMLGKGVLSRRDCVKLMGGFAIAMGTGSLLAGCSSGTSDSGEGASQSDETPKTLRVAMMGSSTDTLDPATFSTLLPLAIALNVYDSLILLRNGVVENSLAESIEPNEDASAWTVTLKDGVKYHDGETVTAEDALYSLQYAGTSPMYSSFYANVDWEGSSVVDERTFTLQLLSPQATFWDEVVSAVTFVFPAGSAGDDFSGDIGSGPFKLVSFSPDTGAVLEKNADYWGGAPAIDTVEIVPITDPETRYTALTSGEVDFAHQISTTNAATLEGQSGFNVLNGGIENSSSFRFCLNASAAPFDDPEVREALKLIVDRQTMNDTIFRSAGVVGNDVLGQGMPATMIPSSSVLTTSTPPRRCSKEKGDDRARDHDRRNHHRRQRFCRDAQSPAGEGGHHGVGEGDRSDDAVLRHEQHLRSADFRNLSHQSPVYRFGRHVHRWQLAVQLQPVEG